MTAGTTSTLAPAAAAPIARPLRRRRLLLATLATTFGVALALATVEIALRVFDPLGLHHEAEQTVYRNQALQYAWSERPLESIDLDGTLYRHKPNLDLDLGSYRLRTNSLGLRSPEVARPKPEGTFRIVVLGDSVAYGTGVDAEVTFLRRWEEELNRSRHGIRFEVVNTGHPMYDTTQELAMLRETGLALDPDLVLLIYVVNDVEPTRDVVEQAVMGKAGDPAEALPDPGDVWTGLAGLLAPVLPATARMLELQSDPLRRFLSTQPAGTEYVPELFGKGPRGWPRSQKALLTIADLCRKAQVPFALLDHSLPEVRALPGFCAANGIRYHAFRFTPEELERPIRNSWIDTHANAAGHELLLAKLRALETFLTLPE